MLEGFGTVCNGLGRRAKPYLPQICGTILWRLNNKSAKVRQQATDLVRWYPAEAFSCLFIVFPISDLQDRTGHEHLPGGEVDGASRCRSLRIPRRGVPRSAWINPWSPQCDCVRHRDDQDDAAYQGPPASTHTNPQESVSLLAPPYVTSKMCHTK